jgi:hypothetical protein
MSSAMPPHAEGDAPSTPRADLHDAVGWILLGVAILYGGVTMDRLEAQGVNPYTVPGLLPGLLGLAMMILGGILAVRSYRAGALEVQASPQPQVTGTARRLAVVLALCLGFGVGLVGHGLPFWLAGAIFVAVAIPTLQAPQRRAAGQRLTLRTIATSIVIGLGAGLGVTLVFQEIFLVRLP